MQLVHIVSSNCNRPFGVRPNYRGGSLGSQRDAQTSGPFSAAQMQAAFPEESFAGLKGYLELFVKAQFLKLLWFPLLEPPAK